jgi:DNA repair exonuclease SbcCD nuclease subunit
MSVRIMHTADNHIGIEFRNQPALRDRLKQERLDALRRIVVEASARDCHFLVVAGDLFDSVNVPAKLVGEVSGILGAFTGDVLVLPGNHDFYEGRESRLWGEFLGKATGTNIHLLAEHAPVAFHVEGREVVFYPCHCPSKRAEKHVAGWVSDVRKSPEALHVGIAHGNVEGLGRDDEGNYFNMTLADLRSAGVACWLLGHIHAPSPQPGYVGSDLFFMPGTHTPEHVKRRTEGYAWYIEVDDASAFRFERFRSGGILFQRVERQLHSESDIASLRQSLDQPEEGVRILDLRLGGRLTEEEIAGLVRLIEELTARYLDVSFHREIDTRIDAARISAEFADGTYPYRLLSGLSESPEDSQALQLAYDIIKTMKP